MRFTSASLFLIPWKVIAMKILRWACLSTEETLKRFQQTRLKGFEQPLVYGKASLSLKPAVATDRLIPAQRYVLQEDLDFVLRLHDFFKAQDIDIFALEGALLFWIADDNGTEDGPIPLCPPLIETETLENGEGIWLINDGMHRVAAARALGKPIHVILADGVDPRFPYYARPLSAGWEDVATLEALPDGFQKKTYRDPENYKALFRDFNAVFPGIQKQRKKSNPESFKA